MPKVGRYTLEHWRDDELLEKVEIKASMITKCKDCAKIVFPAGCIELATEDELHFDRDGLVEVLQSI
jgi:hypothetical protein